MNWRRKVFAFTLALGTGVLCFGPLLSHSISRRLSIEWDVDASVQSAKLSLANSSVAMLDLKIEHPEYSLQGAQAYLKLNQERFWYRDCVIESLVVRDARFNVLHDDGHANTLAAHGSGIAQAAMMISEFESLCTSKENQIRSSMGTAVESFADAERRSLARNQLIDAKLLQFEEDVRGLSQPEHYANPLRAAQRIKAIRSEASQIEQLLAEDRLQLRETRRGLEELLRIANMQSSTVTSASLVPTIDFASIAESIALILANRFETETAPYVKASYLTLEHLATPVVAKPPNPASQRPSQLTLAAQGFNPLSSNLRGADLQIPGLRPRVTRIVKGTIVGQSMIRGSLENLEISLNSSPEISMARNCRVALSWNTPAESPESASASTQTAVVQKASSGVDVDAASWEVELVMNRRDSTSRMSLQNVLTPSRRESTAKITLNSLLHLRELESLPLDLSSSALAHSENWLIATRKEDRDPTISEGVFKDATDYVQNWSFSREDLSKIESFVQQDIHRHLSDRASRVEKTLRTEVEENDSQLQLRLQSFESQNKERQSSWAKRIEQQLTQAKQWESQQLRNSVSAGLNTDLLR